MSWLILIGFNVLCVIIVWVIYVIVLLNVTNEKKAVFDHFLKLRTARLIETHSLYMLLVNMFGVLIPFYKLPLLIIALWSSINYRGIDILISCVGRSDRLLIFPINYNK